MGRILAGGRALRHRSFRLILLDPSARLADQIVRMINARFADAAKGMPDPSRVDINVPKAYWKEKTHYLDIIGSLYLREAPGARGTRIRELAQALKTGRDRDRIAIALEAFGRVVAATLRELVESSNEDVRFYAARTLARLDFPDAVRTLEPIAKNAKSPFQEGAVRALGCLSSGIGLPVLAQALDAPNPLVRLAAYEGMKELGDPGLRGKTFKDKFDFDFLPSRAEPFVFVARRDEPRVVLFGKVHLEPPILIETMRILASSPQGSDKLVLMTKKRGINIKVSASFELKDIIEKIAGPLDLGPEGKPKALDLGYGDVVAFLQGARRTGVMKARVILQPLKILTPGGGRPLGADEGAEIRADPMRDD